MLLWCLFRGLENFFILSSNYREDLLEEFFILNQQMNLSITEARNLPIRMRHWFIKRIIRKLEKNNSIASNSVNKKAKTKKPAKDIDMNKVDKFFAKFGE